MELRRSGSTESVMAKFRGLIGAGLERGIYDYVLTNSKLRPHQHCGAITLRGRVDVFEARRSLTLVVDEKARCVAADYLKPALVGQISFAAGGVPKGRVRVRLIRLAGGDESGLEVEADERGRFELRAFPTGRCLLIAVTDDGPAAVKIVSISDEDVFNGKKLHLEMGR